VAETECYELVHEDAPHLGMEMLHLWYKSYSLHIIVLRGGTIQHGQSDQICSYSETVGSDWSGRAHLYKYVLVHLYKYVLADANPSRHDRYSDQFAPRVVRTSSWRCARAAPGVLIHTYWGRSDQLRSYSETVGSDWSGDNMDHWNLETTLL
jgi:hypothetical protein